MTPEIPDKLEVNKIEVAKRQLAVAITAVFSSVDLVSTHTLAAASHQVLCDLVKHSGKKNPEILYNLIVKDKRDELTKELRQPANFFKHADRDPNQTFTFRPVITHLLIYECICHIALLNSAQSWQFRVFGIWFAREYESLIKDCDESQRCVDIWHQIGCPETLSDFYDASQSPLAALVKKMASSNIDSTLQ